MITIPVLVNFDNSKCIGTLALDESALPKDNANYVFSLGYFAETTEKITPREFYGNYELYCVSLLTDEQYLAYLNQDRQCSKAGE